MTRKTYLFWLAWGVFFLLGVFGTTILLVQHIARVADTPIIFESRAPRPIAVHEIPEEFELSDGQSITQTFSLERIAYTSHIDVGFMDYREANPEGAVYVRILDDTGNTVAEQSVRVRDLYADDLTPMSLQTYLQPRRQYTLFITTQNIQQENRLTPYYGLPGTGIPVGDLSVIQENQSTLALPGQFGFQLKQRPNYQTILLRLQDSPTPYILAGYFFVLGILTLPRIRRWLGVELSRSLPAFTFAKSPPLAEWVGIGLFALLLSFTVTAPLYKDLNLFGDMGDIQRALIFRGIGEDTYKEEGRVAQWDPYLCGGVPLLANIESPHVGPTILFSLLFGENLGLRIETTFMLAVGFMGAYALARMLGKTSPGIALLSGSIFAFSGFQMLAFSTGVLVWLSIGWIPWVLLLAFKSLEKTEYVLGAGFALGILLLSSGPHMPAFAMLTLAIILPAIAIAYRQFRPVLLLGIIIGLGVLIGSLKILPVVEQQALLEDFHRPPVFIAPVSWATKMLFDRDQFSTPSWVYEPTGERNRWHEFGMYVGVLPIVLFFIGIPFYARKRFWIVFATTGIVFFLVTFGIFPWQIIQKIPIANEVFRTASRFRSIFLLFLGMMVAVSSAKLLDATIKNTTRKQIIGALIALAITLDLVLLHGPLFDSLYTKEIVHLPATNSFVRVDGSYTNGDDIYHASYINYLANQGTRDLCVPNLGIGREIASQAQDVEGYVGEAYLPLHGTSLAVDYVSGTHVSVPIPHDIETTQLVVINQNYFPGWHTEPKREVTRWRGMAAARLEPGDTHITFWYESLSYKAGRAFSIIALFLIAIAIILPRYQKPTS